MYHIRLLYSIQFTQNLYLSVKSRKKFMCILSVLKIVFFCYNYEKECVNAMKRKKIALVTVTVSILFTGIVFCVYNLFFNTQIIKWQEYLTESISPDKTYTVTAYLNSGSATSDFSVLGRVKNNKTGKEKNIYWQYSCSEAVITWADDNTVVINGIELDVRNDVYDFRKN